MGEKIVQLDKIWKLTLKLLQDKISDRSLYSSFIEPCYLASLENGEAILVTESIIAKKVLENDHQQVISSCLNKVTESSYTLKIIFKDELKKENISTTKTSSKSKKVNFFENSLLQEKFTFDNFVVGKANKEAFQAAKYVSKNQGKFNPLFIYSQSGLGKTHLLHAIGNYVKDTNSSKKVLYISTDDFINEFVNYATGDSDKESLKDFFRTIDYLLIDDIQLLCKKPATEIMFFNVFNLLVDSGKQIVITSDRSPNQLEGLEDRLVSRFSQGLSVNIEKPSLDTLIEISKMKIKSNGFDPSIFDDDALEYLTVNNSTNIRVLEGALNRILFFNIDSDNIDRITIDIVKRAFEKDIETIKKGEKLSVDKIINFVSNYYNLTPNQLLSSVKTSQIALARAIAMYLSRKLLNMSYPSIATAFKKKDHTTVISACKKVDNLIKTDDSMKKIINQLSSQLKA
jgi:chromosomal replication initiator protein